MKNSQRFFYFAQIALAIVLSQNVIAADPSYSTEIEVGLGYDSNAYLAPIEGYDDPLVGGFVNPEEQSGFYIPFEFKGELELGSKRARFINKVKFNGDKYLDSDLENADQYGAKFATGIELSLNKDGSRGNTFYIGPSIAYNRKIYFDRDSGLEKTTSQGETLKDRYKYIQYGLEADLKVRAWKVPLRIKVDVRKLNYEETAISSLDHTYYRVKAQAGYKLTRVTKVKVSYEYFSRDYRTRKARNIEGRLFKSNPDLLEYTYQNIGLSLRNRLGKRWVAYLDYDYFERVDQSVGYNDYQQNRYQIRLKYHDKADRRLRISLAFWDRDYPRAFVFERSTYDLKSYNTREAAIEGEIPLNKRLVIWASYELINQNTSDPRYNYDRHLGLLGIRLTL